MSTEQEHSGDYFPGRRPEPQVAKVPKVPEKVTDLIELASASAIVAGVVIVLGFGIGLIVGGLLGMVFSVRMAS